MDRSVLSLDQATIEQQEKRARIAALKGSLANHNWDRPTTVRISAPPKVLETTESTKKDGYISEKFKAARGLFFVFATNLATFINNYFIKPARNIAKSANEFNKRMMKPFVNWAFGSIDYDDRYDNYTKRVDSSAFAISTVTNSTAPNVLVRKEPSTVMFSSMSCGCSAASKTGATSYMALAGTGSTDDVSAKATGAAQTLKPRAN